MINSKQRTDPEPPNNEHEIPTLSNGEGGMRQLLTVKEIANTLQCSTFHIYRLVGQNRIPHLRVAGGSIRFDPDEIEAWLQKQKVSA